MPDKPVDQPREEVRDLLRQTTDGRENDIFFAAVEKTRMPMVVTDPNLPDNPIIFANQAFLSMTGYDAAEVLGSNCRFLQGPETDKNVVSEMRAALETGREVSVEILNYRKNGSTFWNALFISPVYDKAGNLIYLFGSQLDISRRRDAEEALRQAQKMEALGQLTGGIAHDFNNLLQVMMGYHELATNALGRPNIDSGRITRNLEHAQTAAQRASTLTQQLLAFARKQHLRGRTVNLNDTVAGMDDIIRRTFADRTIIEMDLAPGLWNCRVDPTQCEVALLNVLINARDALKESSHRTVRLQTRNVTAGADKLAQIAGLRAGQYASISVADTGAGMSGEVLSRALEPFFTTKDEGQGTGLGLSTVYGFAKQSGGSVHIESTEGHGTTVHLFFPAAEEDAPRAQGGPERAMDRGGQETILVVEDRREVGDLAQAFLEDFGYHILRAANAAEALTIIDNNPGIDLIFTDLIMPGGMNGVLLAREAKRRQPKMKVLLTTGYAEASLERQDTGGTEFDVINKPYRRGDLGRLVRLVLDGPTGVS